MTLYLASGTASGQGTLSIPIQDLAGTTAGLATVTGNAVRIIRLTGLTRGNGTLGGYFPDPIIGTSNLVGGMVVTSKPNTVCSCSSGTTSGTSNSTTFGPFYWNQFFQPTDLQLFVRTTSGPVMPASVSYTLYWLRNGNPVQAGPANRAPGHGPLLGQFYVTGKVGEYGQPGSWLVRWHIQRFYFSEITEVEATFTVQDAVAAADPRDTTIRIAKYGWD